MPRSTLLIIASFCVLAGPIGSTRAAFEKVTDFNELSLGGVVGQGGWTGSASTGSVAADPEDATNQVLAVLTNSGLLRKQLTVANDETHMLFFRFRFGEQQKYSIGMSPLSAPDEFSDFGPEMGMANASNDLRAWNGDAAHDNYVELESLDQATWYNCWMLINSTDNNMQLWVNDTPGGKATAEDLMEDDDDDTVFGFRSGASADMINIYIRVGGGNSSGGSGGGGAPEGPVYIDDFYLEQVSGARDLYNPVSGTTPCDFDNDGDCDVDDLDSLTLVGNLLADVSVPPADAKYDLTDNETVNVADLYRWLTDAATQNGHASLYRPGDTELDRDVDITDFNTVVTNFDPGAANAGNKWSLGDFDGDNDIDITDFGLLATSYAPGGYDGAGAADTVPEAVSGGVDLVVDLATGEVTLDGNAAAISGLQVFSAGDSLLASDFTADVLQFVISTNTSTYAEGAFLNMQVDGVVSLGELYDLLADARDLAFEYTMLGEPTVTGNVIYIPEPASVLSLVVGVLILYRRRSV